MLGTCDVYEFVKRDPATIADIAKHFGVSPKEAETAVLCAAQEGVAYIGVGRFGGRLYGLSPTHLIIPPAF